MVNTDVIPVTETVAGLAPYVDVTVEVDVIVSVHLTIVGP